MKILQPKMSQALLLCRLHVRKFWQEEVSPVSGILCLFGLLPMSFAFMFYAFSVAVPILDWMRWKAGLTALSPVEFPQVLKVLMVLAAGAVLTLGVVWFTAFRTLKEKGPTPGSWEDRILVIWSGWSIAQRAIVELLMMLSGPFFVCLVFSLTPFSLVVLIDLFVWALLNPFQILKHLGSVFVLPVWELVRIIPKFPAGSKKLVTAIRERSKVLLAEDEAVFQAQTHLEETLPDAIVVARRRRL
jgi:hypothetical protein